MEFFPSSLYTYLTDIQYKAESIDHSKDQNIEMSVETVRYYVVLSNVMTRYIKSLEDTKCDEHSWTDCFSVSADYLEFIVHS